MIYPSITLTQPWATWIIRGWKTIETRTHNRFACLDKKTILIHAGMTTDKSAANNPYLTKDQLMYNPDEMVNGFILGNKNAGRKSRKELGLEAVVNTTVQVEKSVIEKCKVRHGSLANALRFAAK